MAGGPIGGAIGRPTIEAGVWGVYLPGVLERCRGATGSSAKNSSFGG
jgi:hypothetical protein